MTPIEVNVSVSGVEAKIHPGVVTPGKKKPPAEASGLEKSLLKDLIYCCLQHPSQ
jgi:hypothetical protein